LPEQPCVRCGRRAAEFARYDYGLLILASRDALPDEKRGAERRLDLRWRRTQTRLMAHIYLTFDFGTDEDRAQQARHKLDGWKQAFRLDKRLEYKFERSETRPPADGTKEAETAPAKSGKAAKGSKAGKGAGAKGKPEIQKNETPAPTTTLPVKLHLRLAFSGHEKMTEERWVKRIPGEEPFKEASPKTVKAGDAEFQDVESRFDALE